MATGILRLRSATGTAGWKWLFLIEGLLTLVVGIMSFFLMPPSPTQTRTWFRPKGWFNERFVSSLLVIEATLLTLIIVQRRDYNRKSVCLTLPCRSITRLMGVQGTARRSIQVGHAQSRGSDPLESFQSFEGLENVANLHTGFDSSAYVTRSPPHAILSSLVSSDRSACHSPADILDSLPSESWLQHDPVELAYNPIDGPRYPHAPSLLLPQ